MGVLVDGLPVVGFTHMQDQGYLSAKLLGHRPPNKEVYAGKNTAVMEGLRVKAKWFEERFSNPFPADATEMLVQQYARFYILGMLGGMLFMDKSGEWLSIMYLQFFNPIKEDSQANWRCTTIGAVVGVGEVSTHMSCDEASTLGTALRSTCYQVCRILDSYRFTFPH